MGVTDLLVGTDSLEDTDLLEDTEELVLARFLTSPYLSLSRESTEPLHSPRPLEPPWLLCMTLLTLSLEPTVVVMVSSEDMELLLDTDSLVDMDLLVDMDWLVDTDLLEDTDWLVDTPLPMPFLL